MINISVETINSNILLEYVFERIQVTAMHFNTQENQKCANFMPKASISYLNNYESSKFSCMHRLNTKLYSM